MSTPSVAITPPKTSIGKPDLATIKQKQKATWASGDYALIGATLQIVAESLCETANIRPGERVLDVATGHGNAAIAAARRFGDVVATDYVPSLLERGRQRAEAERLPVKFIEGDAEDLRFPDASFDVVLSTFGVMFAPDHLRSAAELARVCMPGGRIALANWTPGSFIGHVFKTVARHLPPPPGLQSPALWGDPQHVRELFGPRAKNIAINRREFVFRYRSASDWLEVFRTFYGPVHKAFLALDASGQVSLEKDLLTLLASHNRSTDKTLAVPSEYLEIIIDRA